MASILKIKSEAFAIRIVNLKKHLQEVHHEYEMSKQIIRAGTSINANINEAFAAQSDADYLSKLHISNKEANETRAWLTILYKTGYITEREYNSIYPECIELIRLLYHAIKKKSAKHNQSSHK